MLSSILKYDPSQPRDKNGRWVDAGTGFAMVSPNVEEGLDLSGATKQLSSGRHRELRAAFDQIDSMLGLAAHTEDGVGAWADGAEGSTITQYKKEDLEEVRVAAAMKGWISDQKAVIAFKASPNGSTAMYSTRVRGDMESVHKELLEAGIEFHTLVPDGDGVKVFTFDESGGLAKAFSTFARDHGSKSKIRFGEGEFIGSWDSREEGRQAYEREIEGFLGRRDDGGSIGRLWVNIRDRWGAEAKRQGLRKADRGEFVILDSPLNPASTNAEIEAWIEQLLEMPPSTIRDWELRSSREWLSERLRYAK